VTGLQTELTVSAAMVALMILAHLLGLAALLQTTRWYVRHLKSPWLTFDRFAVPLLMGVGLFALHTGEIWAYALLFRHLGVPSFETALYVSTSAYSSASLNYFDARPAWRLLAAHESVAGMILLGWSTAFLFATLSRILTTEETHPLPEGAIAPEPAGDQVVPHNG
jgi:hypothetical protein